MQYLLSSEEMSRADLYTQEVIGIPSLVLMERAALAVADAVSERFEKGGVKDRFRLAIAFAGSGNNGADALAAGRILEERGYRVLYIVMDEKEPKGSSKVQRSILSRLDAKVLPYEEARLTEPVRSGIAAEEESDQAAWKSTGQAAGIVVIDGLFGTGLGREVTGRYAEAVRDINRLKENGAFVVSVDIPSGISGSTGQVMGEAVRADLTVTFAFYKKGHFLYPGCEYCGNTVLRKIGITERSLEDTPSLFIYDTEKAEDLLPARKASGNKGTFGKLLVIAGSVNVAGAALMCAESALRCGAGMVKVFTEEGNRSIIQTALPEAMMDTWTEEEDPSGRLDADLAWADVALIGPGIGKTKRMAGILKTVLTSDRIRGLVMDADAIRLIAEEDLYVRLKEAGLRMPVILTPHLAEFSALSGIPVRELAKNLPSYVKDFADRHHCVILCKDARSVAAGPGILPMYLNVSGNSGLAKAGSGDVLAGMCAAFLSQGMEAFPAACAASWLHGKAAELLTSEACQGTLRSLIATDLIKVMDSSIRKA